MKIIGAIFLAALSLAAAKDCSGKKGQSKLVCYYSKITDIDSCQCTHVILPPNSDVKSIERLRSSLSGVKILVTVHEFNEGLINILKSSKVDGLEINLKKLESRNDISDFISTVKEKLGSDLYIVVSVPPKPEALAKYYDFKSLTKNTDLFILQTAFLGANNNVTFHPSRLSGLWDMQNADSVVDLVSGLGTPLSKLVIASPVQAFQFTLQSSKHTAPGSPALDISSMSRDELCTKMSSSNWTLERDQDQTAPYIFRNDKWIAFEDQMSIDIKAKYSRVRGLAGLALKDLSQDGGEKCGQTILQAAYNGLSKQARAPRGVVLHSLEREILETPARPLDTVQVSPYRISRVIDVEGKVHVVRQDTRTEFECSRQGYFVHPRSCGRFYRCVKFDQLTDEFNVFEFDCPAGLAFDSRVEVCVWPGSLPHGSPCSGSSEIAPVPRERFICPQEQGYYADPENCRWFFACLDHGKSPLSAYEFRCPFGLVFDQDRLLCEWPWLVPKCGSGNAAGAIYGFENGQVDFYGGTAGHVQLNQYDGLGHLQTIPLGGLHGPLQQTPSKLYSSVGTGNTLDSSGESILSTNGNADNLRGNYLSSLQGHGGATTQGLSGNTHASYNIQVASGEDGSNTRLSSSGENGVGIHVAVVDEGVTGFSHNFGGHTGIHSGGNVLSVSSGDTANLEEGNYKVAFGIDDSEKVKLVKSSNFADVNVDLGRFQGGSVVKTSDKLNLQGGAGKSVVYQANYLQPAGKIDIVGGGYSAVGSEISSGLEDVKSSTYNKENINSGLQFVTAKVPVVTSVPIPTHTAADIESYHGGVVANIPELQYKVSSPASFSHSNNILSSSRGESGQSKVINYYHNTENTTPGSVSIASTPIYSSTVKLSSPRPLRPAGGTSYVQTNIHHNQPVAVAHEEYELRKPNIAFGLKTHVPQLVSVQEQPVQGFVQHSIVSTASPTLVAQPAISTTFDHGKSSNYNTQTHQNTHGKQIVFDSPKVYVEQSPVVLTKYNTHDSSSKYSKNQANSHQSFVQHIQTKQPELAVIQEVPQNNQHVFGTTKIVGNNEGYRTSSGVGTSQRFGASQSSGTSQHFGKTQDFIATQDLIKTQDYGTSHDLGTSQHYGPSHDSGRSQEYVAHVVGTSHDSGSSKDFGTSQDFGTSKHFGTSQDFKTSQDLGTFTFHQPQLVVKEEVESPAVVTNYNVYDSSKLSKSNDFAKSHHNFVNHVQTSHPTISTISFGTNVDGLNTGKYVKTEDLSSRGHGGFVVEKQPVISTTQEFGDNHDSGRYVETKDYSNGHHSFVEHKQVTQPVVSTVQQFGKYSTNEESTGSQHSYVDNQEIRQPVHQFNTVEVKQPEIVLTRQKIQTPAVTSTFSFSHPQQEKILVTNHQPIQKTFHHVSTERYQEIPKPAVFVSSTPSPVSVVHFEAPQNVKTYQQNDFGKSGSYFYEKSSNENKAGHSFSTVEHNQYNSKPNLVFTQSTPRPVQVVQYHQPAIVSTTSKPLIKEVHYSNPQVVSTYENEELNKFDGYYHENEQSGYRGTTGRPALSNVQFTAHQDRPAKIAIKEQPVVVSTTEYTNPSVEHNVHYVQPGLVSVVPSKTVVKTNFEYGNRFVSSTPKPFTIVEHTSVQPAIVSGYKSNNYTKTYRYQQQPVVYESKPIQPAVVSSFSISSFPQKSANIETLHYEQNTPVQQPTYVKTVDTYDEGQYGYKDNTKLTFNQKTVDVVNSAPIAHVSHTYTKQDSSHSTGTVPEYGYKTVVEQKPAVVAFSHEKVPVLTTYENQQPIYEEPFVKKTAYVTGVDNQETYEYQGPSYRFEQKDAIVSPTPNYVESHSTTKYRESYSTPKYVATYSSPKYVETYSTPKPAVVSVKTGTTKTNYDNGYYFVSSTAKPQTNVNLEVDNYYNKEYSYSSTPRPSYRTTVAAVIAEKQPITEPKLKFYSYDSRLSTTPRTIIKSTVAPAVTAAVITESKPISRYSFGSLDKEYQQPIQVVPVVSSTTPGPVYRNEYVDGYIADKVEVSTPGYAPVKVTKVVEDYSNKYYESEDNANREEEYVVVKATTRRPAKVVKVVRPKSKSYIMENDFHPFLSAKLGAQCTCMSNQVKLRKKPVKQEEYREEGNREGKFRIEISGDDSDEDSKSFLIEDYAYEPQKEVASNDDFVIKSTTVAPSTSGVIYTIKKRVRTRPVSSTEAYVQTVSPTRKSSSLRILKDKQEGEERLSDEELGKAVRKGLTLVKSAVKEGVREGVEEALEGRNFDRYGPGGWRSREETLQGTVDCQRAGLFRHPTQCNKFYACRWDCNKNRFTLHVFNCPVHLTFDNNLGACNWPSQGPACMGNTLLPSE